MQRAVPWERAQAKIELLYPTSGRVGLQVVFADAGYTGVHKRAEVIEAQAAGKLCAEIDRQAGERRSRITKLSEDKAKEIRQALERPKVQVRTRVVHPFHVVKNLFRYHKSFETSEENVRRRIHSLRGSWDCANWPLFSASL